MSACAREGCVELVLDLRPRQPRRLPYGAQPGTSVAAALAAAAAAAGEAADDAAALADQDARIRIRGAAGSEGGALATALAAALGAAAAAAGGGSGAGGALSLEELAVVVAEQLQRAGLLRPDCEPSVVLQVGLQAVGGGERGLKGGGATPHVLGDRRCVWLRSRVVHCADEWVPAAPAVLLGVPALTRQPLL